MKNTNLLVMTALVVGLAACGGDDEPVVTPNPYPPGGNYPIPQEPSSEAFTSNEQWMISQMQATFGNITTNKAAILGNSTLPIGTHSWQTILDRVQAAAEACGSSCEIRQHYGQYQDYSYYSPMAHTDFNRLKQYLNYQALSSVGVRYANDPGYTRYSIVHSVDLVLKTLQNSYSQMFNQWYGYGNYPVVYQPGYYGGGMNVGLNYNSGYLQLNFGAGL